MNQLFTIIKIQLQNQLLQTNSKKDRKIKIPSSVISFLVMFGLSVYYSFLLMEVYKDIDLQLVPLTMISGATFLTFLVGISTAQGVLFGFKDYDMLRSFPIKENHIVISKIVVFLIIEYLYSAFFVLPSMIIYGIFAKCGIMFYISTIIGFIAFPLIPVTLASFIGIGIKSISAGKKYSTLIQNILTILGFILIYVFSFRLGNSFGENPGAIGTQMTKALDYLISAKLFFEGTVKVNALSLALLYVFGILAISCLIFIYSKLIVRINGKAEQGYHVKDFKLKQSKSNGLFWTLLKKEIRRYFSNFMYFFNTLGSLIIMIITAVYVAYMLRDELPFVREFITSIPKDMYWMIAHACILVIATFGQMVCTTGVSISLEAKTMWLLKSLPIKTESIFFSKILVNLIVVIIPTMLLAIAVGLILHLDVFYYITSFIFLFVTAIFVSFLGLLINLRFPKLEYDNEVVVIKRSLSSFLSIMVPFLLAIGVCIIFFVLYFNDFGDYFNVILIVYCILDIIIIYLVLTYGKAKFKSLVC